jgi:hypothetical protein
MRRFTLAALTAAAASALVLAPALGASATTTQYPPAPFTPYDVSQTWYAPTPATVDNPFAVPQTTKVLTCGGIRQDDKYHIDTAELDVKYKELIAGGVLPGPEADAPFHPVGVVTALPDCAPVVVIPPKPDNKVDVKVTHSITCEPGEEFYYTVTTTTTTPFVYDKETNSWLEGTPVVVTETHKKAATAEQCPPIKPTPPVTPPKPPVVPPVTVTPPPTTTPPVVSTPPTKPHTELAGSKLKPADAMDLTQPKAVTDLAYTGTDPLLTWTLVAGGLALIVAGAAGMIFTHMRRRLN